MISIFVFFWKIGSSHTEHEILSQIMIISKRAKPIHVSFINLHGIKYTALAFLLLLSLISHVNFRFVTVLLNDVNCDHGLFLMTTNGDSGVTSSYPFLMLQVDKRFLFGDCFHHGPCLYKISNYFFTYRLKVRVLPDIQDLP